MSILDETSLDDRARPIFDMAPAPPTDRALQAALHLDDDPSPAMLEHFAAWLDRVEALAGAGLAPDEILRVSLRALVECFRSGAPPAQVLAHLLASPPGLAAARDLCDALLARDLAALSFPLRAGAQAALERLAADDALETRDLALLHWDHVDTALPAVAAALPTAKREAFVRACARRDDAPASMRLAALLAARAAVDSPALVAIREELLVAARDEAARLEDEDDRAEQIARLEEDAAAHAAPPVAPPRRPTERARQSLAYLERGRAARRREAALGPLAEVCWSERVVAVDAPELATMAAWGGAGDTRRRHIAEAVAAAVQGEFTELRSFGANRIAVITVDGLPFCLVPGGAVSMGFSEAEEHAVRAAASARAGGPNHHERYTSLLLRREVLRPVTQVRVGPLLAQQEPSRPVEPAEVTTWLEGARFRLPSEAEWEHLARGGAVGELTYVGPEVPDDDAWLPNVARQGLERANDFGLWGFGFEPEVCADVWHPSHEGAALDGAPRRGLGPRVVRGGAGQLYPFQGTGEWHLLLSAVRSSQATWRYAQAIRRVIGVQIDAPSR